MQGVNEVVNLTNLGLENYVKECRERLLTAARSVDYDLIEPIRETTIQAKKQKEESKNSWDGKLHVVSWERCCMLFHGKDVACCFMGKMLHVVSWQRCCMASLYDKLRK